MDTKSKRFDKLSIIRLICFILAVVFALVGSMNVISFVSFIDQNDAYDEAAQILDDYFTGSRIDDADDFTKEYREFLTLAVSKALLFPSADKKGYNAYLERAKEKYHDNIVNTILKDTSLGTDYFVFYAFDKGYINLSRIGECDDVDKDTRFYYNDGEGGRVWFDDPDNFSYSIEHSRLQDYYEAEGEDYHDFFETTYSYDEDSSSGEEESPVRYESQIMDLNDYVSEAINLVAREDLYRVLQTKNGTKYTDNIYVDGESLSNFDEADAYVRIENAYYGEKEVHYSGIYAVTVNDDAIDVFNPDYFYSYSNDFPTDEDHYLSERNGIKESLSAYKNAFYAVKDEKTGNFCTNLPSPDGKIKVTEDNITDVMSEFCGANNAYKYSSSHASTWDGNFSRIVFNFAKNEITSVIPENSKYTLWAGYDSSLSHGEDAFSKMATIKDGIIDSFKVCITPVVISLLGWLICLVVLLFMTGRRSYDDELHMGRLDGIPTEIKLVLNLGLSVLAVWGALVLMFENGYYYDPATHESLHMITTGAKYAALAACTLVSLLVMDLVLYCARHIKNRSLLKNISVIRFILFVVRKSNERKAKLADTIPEYDDFKKKVRRVLIPVLAIPDIAAVIFFLALSDYWGGEWALMIPVIGVLEYFAVKFILRYVTGIRSIFDAMHGMRTGKPDVYVDPVKMPKSLKPYADDVNYVSEGLSIAVENATKEQRTRTELITNVSHDLKTPLTSIINYVDLLSKRPIDDFEARKYIAVLGEKSEKLKKLIEDLVEASKASAGNIQVNFVRMSLHELVSQVIGEYEDDLLKKNLTVYIEEKEDNVTVSADSKLASRVLDNLMVNIRKYAMPGTRVYVKIMHEEEYGSISISNISEQQLNIPASELKERFVRGDSSRSTEGSGLGLAIAEDFMSLQNGKLDLEINGDMFTAVVRFKISQ